MNVQTITKKATYLTFMLGKEVFAVNVAKVREVLELTKITKVPKTPDYMQGVINLRGSVVPVVDLKLKFGMQKTEESINTCIVVMEIEMENEITVLGGLADSVEEVIDLEPENIEAAPQIGSSLNTDFIKGMGKKDEEFIIILDIDKIFSEKEIEVVSKAGKKGNQGKVDQEGLLNG
jgi:purine-binding chemotaxis protein CheW